MPGETTEPKPGAPGRVLLPPTYLPLVSWFTVYAAAAVPLVSLYSRYEKQKLYNRTHIKGANGAQVLSASVERQAKYAPLSETRLVYQEDWPRLHCRALQTAYGKTPFGAHYLPDVFAVVESRPALLADLNLSLIKLLARKLGLPECGVSSGPSDASADFSFYGDLFAGRNPAAEWYAPPEYYQPFGPFAPDLSALDLLCNLGPEAPLALNASFRGRKG